jgi:uncharacterized protein with HEPN domain
MNPQDTLRISDYLEHILEALQRIFTYLDDIDELNFIKDPLLQDAVLRNIEVIGEAANNLVKKYPAFIDEYDSIPWSEMYWMRNRVSHGYFSVDFEIIWRTIERELPGLYKDIKKIQEKIKPTN